MNFHAGLRPEKKPYRKRRSRYWLLALLAAGLLPFLAESGEESLVEELARLKRAVTEWTEQVLVASKELEKRQQKPGRSQSSKLTKQASAKPAGDLVKEAELTVVGRPQTTLTASHHRSANPPHRRGSLEVIYGNHKTIAQFPPEWKLDRPFPTSREEVARWNREVREQREEWGLEPDGEVGEETPWSADDPNPKRRPKKKQDQEESEEQTAEEAAEDEKEDDNNEDDDERRKIGLFAYSAVDFQPGYTYRGLRLMEKRKNLDQKSYVRSYAPFSMIDPLVRSHADFIGPGHPAWDKVIEKDRRHLEQAMVEGKLLIFGHSGSVTYEVVSFPAEDGSGEMVPGYIEDGEGYDFKSCSNSFEVTVNTLNDKRAEDWIKQFQAGSIFAELATVEVGESLDNMVAFDCQTTPSTWTDPETGRTITDYPGCAGVKPVRLGCDTFDLAELGLQRVRYIRFTDNGDNPPKANGYDQDDTTVLHGFVDLPPIDYDNLALEGDLDHDNAS